MTLGLAGEVKTSPQPGRKPAGRNLSGLTSVDVKFGPDGNMYVDFGVFEINGQVPNAVPGTGVIWQVFRQRSERRIPRRDHEKD